MILCVGVGVGGCGCLGVACVHAYVHACAIAIFALLSPTQYQLYLPELQLQYSLQQVSSEARIYSR